MLDTSSDAFYLCCRTTSTVTATVSAPKLPFEVTGKTIEEVLIGKIELKFL